MNIIPTRPTLPQSIVKPRVVRNDAAQERHKSPLRFERRKNPERRVASQKFPIELRSGTDRRQGNRVSIST